VQRPVAEIDACISNIVDIEEIFAIVYNKFQMFPGYVI